MKEILSNLWFAATLMSVCAMGGIALYLWYAYAGRPETRGFFLCLVGLKATICFEEICACIGTYGVSPECFTTYGLIIRLLGRLAEFIVAIIIFRYFISRQRS